MEIPTKKMVYTAYAAIDQAKIICTLLKEADEFFLFASCKEGRHSSVLSEDQQRRLGELSAMGLLSCDTAGWWYPTPLGVFVLNLEHQPLP